LIESAVSFAEPTGRRRFRLPPRRCVLAAPSVIDKSTSVLLPKPPGTTDDMSKASRKSKKKKRHHERRRERHLQQQRREGHHGGDGAASSGVPTRALAALTRKSVAASHIENQRNVRSAEKRPLVPQEKNAFGSAASRRRALPTVSFVFPRQDCISQQLTDTASKHYQFGIQLGRLNDLDSSPESRPQRERAKSSCSDDTTTASKTKLTTIDEILYPEAKVVGQVDAGTAVQKALSVHKDSGLPKHNDDTLKQATVNEDQKKNADIPMDSSPPSRGHRCESGVTVRSPYLSGVSVEEAVRDKHGLRPRSNSTDGELNLPQRGLCDERKVLESYRWSRNISMVPPRGFNNLGNTCFLNSTLQCLAYCPPFCQSIMAMHNTQSTFAQSRQHEHENNKNNHGKRMTLMLGALFRQVHGTGGNNNNNHFQNSNDPITPRIIVNSIPTLGNSGNRNGYKFQPGRQEDSHEFLVHLLDAMNDGELREAGIDAHKSGWRDRLPAPRLDETTFVHRIFGGYLRSQVRCTVCGYKSNTYDPFLDLSLEISRKSCHNLATAFQQFTRKETLDSENRWKCSGCKKRVCATKQLTVFRPPLALCIQLKRFSYGGSLLGGFGGYGDRMGGKKITKPIEFPTQMKLPLSDGRSCGYALTGIVIHVGGSASSGHYTAYVKKPGKHQGEDKWFHMDDSFVQAVTEREVLRQRDAYVLLYCRKEVKLEFPSPPLRGSMTAEEAIKAQRARARARSDSLTEHIGGGPSSATSSSSAAAAAGPRLKALTEEQEETHLSPPATTDSKSDRVVKQNGVELKASAAASEPANKSKQAFIGPLPMLADNIESTSRAPGLNEAFGGHSVKKKENAMQNGEPREAGPGAESDGSSSETSSESSSSSDSSSSSSDDSSSDSEGSECSAKPVDKNQPTKAKPEVKRIVHDRGENGMVEVMMGPRYKKKNTWRPKSVEASGDGFVLLGNAQVDRWDDDESVDGATTALQSRTRIAEDEKRKENKRKRKMYLDRHDAVLDLGKVSRTSNSTAVLS